jgi:NADPH:quinone reductase-like Zn-dependent oxidoreductase
VKAVLFEKQGIENLKVIQNVDTPKISDNDVLVKVKMAGVNPIDFLIYFTT